MIDGEPAGSCTAAIASATSSNAARTARSRTSCGPASGTPPITSRRGPVPPEVLTVLRALPTTTKPMDALRTAVSTWGAVTDLAWPPTVEQARALTSASPSMLAAFARIRQGLEPIEPDPSLDLVAGFLYQLKGSRPTPARRRRSMRTSWSARSTASTRRPSRRASSSRRARTSRPRSPGRSAR